MMTMPDRNLNVALIPLDIVYADRDANLRLAHEAIRSLKHCTDLVVLPEMFTSSFITDTDTLSHAADPVSGGKVIDTVRSWASEFDMCICGSFTAGDGGAEFYNRGFMVLPDGNVHIYDKHHLFSAGGESKIMSAGSGQSPIVEFRSWRLKMSICYDIRFPVWNRNRRLEYDALIVPANWPQARYYAWKHLLIARAIENQAYVLGCNRSGHDAYGEYPAEGSLLIDYWGKDISERDPLTGIVYGTLDAARLTHDRHRFRPWMDADEFSIL
ncbi:MAG: nitrilase family protein [Muribaculaceae bacterium]|nr:nitrilase family protein [Muribaculaceae bacterium]